MTVVGTTIGSPKYMSPEQAQGLQVDGRSDFYSLGVVLYEVLTGHVPFSADSSVALALKHMNEDVPALPESFAELNPFFRKILAKRPEERFKNGQEIVDEFLKWLHQANVSEITLTANSGNRVTEIYSNSLLSKVSQISKSLPKHNHLSEKKKLIVSIAAVIAIASSVYYVSSVKDIEKQQYINTQLSSAYNNLQKSNLAESLINFRSVLDVDKDNEVAKKSIGIGRKLLIEDLNKHLANNDFNYVENKLKVLTSDFLEEPDFSEFLINYQILKAKKENREKIAGELDKLVALYNQAIENEMLVVPENKSAAHYLEQIIKLNPDDVYYLEQKKTLSVKTIEQIKDVFRVLGAKEAKKLVEAFSVYFDVNKDYEEVQFQVIQAHEIEEKKNRNLKLTEQKIASELSELELLILNTESYVRASYKGLEYFKYVDSYIRLGGSNLKVISMVIQDINIVVDELNSVYIDSFDLDAGLNQHQYEFIAQHKELKNPYREMTSLIASIRKESSAYSNFMSSLESIKKSLPLGDSWIESFSLNLNKVAKMKLSPAAVSNLRNEVGDILKNAIDRAIGEKNSLQVKHLATIAKLYLPTSEVDKILTKIQNIEQDIQKIEINQQRVSKEILTKFSRYVKDGAYFTPAGSSAAEYLMVQKGKGTLSSSEIQIATENLFEQVSKQLSVLIAQKKVQDFQQLYSVVESYFDKLSPSSEAQARLRALQNRNNEIKKALAVDLKQFENAIGTFEVHIKNGDLDTAWALFIELKAKYGGSDNQNYLISLEQREKSFFALLCNRLDQLIVDNDKKSAEALFKKGLLLFPKNSELLSREHKIKQLREKEVKILSF